MGLGWHTEASKGMKVQNRPVSVDQMLIKMNLAGQLQLAAEYHIQQRSKCKYISDY